MDFFVRKVIASLDAPQLDAPSPDHHH